MDPDIEIAKLHIEANTRSTALNIAVSSLEGNETPASSEAIVSRAKVFYDFLASK